MEQETKQEIEQLLFGNYIQLVTFASGNTNREQFKPATYFHCESKAESCIPTIRGKDGSLRIQYLRHGERNLEFALCQKDLNDDVFIFRGLMIDLARAVFWPEGKEVIYVDLVKKENYHATIAWRNEVYSSSFEVWIKPNSEEETEYVIRRSSEQYGKNWLLIDPETV